MLSDFQDRFPYLESGVAFFEKERDRKKKEAVERIKKTARVRRVDVKKEAEEFVFSSPSPDAEPVKRPPAFVFREEEPEEGEITPYFSLNEEERALLERVPYTPVTADGLANGGSVPELLRVLTKLEINGLVRRLPGGTFVRADRAEERQ